MKIPTIYNQIDDNKNKTWLLMALFTTFIVLVVWIFARGLGADSLSALGMVGIAFFISAIINIISYYYSDTVVLKISGAQPLDPTQNQGLYNLVDNLCTGAGLPVPKIYIINDSAPNAFATGRNPNNAAIAVTIGLLEKLDRQELEGVIAHELSHIKNYDTRYMSIVVMLVGLVALLADVYLRTFMYGGTRKRSDNTGPGSGGGIFIVLGIMFALLSPLIAELLKLAVSRQREYLADASAALLTRYPEGLARALEKISADKEPLEVANKATAHMYIINPLKDWGGKLNELFSTHPPVEERIKRLRLM